MTKSKLRRKGLIWLTLPHPSSSLKEVREGTWRQELIPKQEGDATYLFVPNDLLSLLSSRTQDHQIRGCPTYIIWPLPHQSIIKKIVHRKILIL